MADTNPSTQVAGGMGTANPKMRCTIIPFPKVIFFYPLAIISLISGFIELAAEMKGPSADGTLPYSTLAGTMFVLVFFVNILIFSFDFPGVKAIALALGIIAAVVGLLYLDNLKNGAILGPLKEISKHLFEKVHASPTLYFMVSGILAAMIFGGFSVNALWNRWIAEPTRLIHIRGILGDIVEYPVIDLQVQKKIEDVFEFALLGAGTLTFVIPGNPPIVLENVLFVNRAERRIRDVVRKRGIGVS